MSKPTKDEGLQVEPPQVLYVGPVQYVRADVYALAVMSAQFNAQTVRDMQAAARASESAPMTCQCASRGAVVH